MLNFKNRVLLVADLSNVIYQAVFSAKNAWEREYPEESSFMKNRWRTDQENLPNLLNYQNFRRILGRKVQEKVESVVQIARKWHQAEIDSAEGVDFFLSEDDFLSGNFRKRIYPEYKQQRKVALKEFDVSAAIDYARNVVMKDLGLEKTHGCKFVKVKDCESDDVIAVLMGKYRDYMCRILVSSDKDYLQIEGINQYDGWGKKVVPYIKSVKQGALDFADWKEFLLWKIIRGDPSDNIKGVFKGYGHKKSFLLARDKDRLKAMLKEDLSAAQRFKRNMELIDFRKIPKDMVERIEAVLEEKMSEIKEPESLKAGGCIVLEENHD